MLSFFLFQEQEDPNKLATSWPDYYIDRINSMAAVSGRPLLPCPHLERLRQRVIPPAPTPDTPNCLFLLLSAPLPTHWSSAFQLFMKF